MARISPRRRGLGFRPPEGWPLDDLLVGVGTLRTLRELIRREREERRRAGAGRRPEATSTGLIAPFRPWDVALTCDVTPQGATKVMDRLHRLELLRRFPAERYGRADGFLLDRSHPMAPGLVRLFEEESVVLGRRHPPRSPARLSLA
ncbi:MAG TPA: hypothetical protein VKA44_02645 [Gemmatimonadota bacterium]|nr:hypothetical protein [Gemmatimonadota bacterium]